MQSFVLNDAQKSGSNVIFDNCEIEGVPLLKAILKHFTETKNLAISLYCFVHKPAKFQSCLTENSNVKVYDYTNDFGSYNFSKSLLNDIFHDNDHTIIFLDDLSRYITINSLQKACKLLNQFKNNSTSKLFTIFHSDLHNETISSSIQHYSQSVILLTLPSTDDHWAKAFVSFKSKVGKIKTANELLKISEVFKIFVEADIPKIKMKQEVKKEDPLADLTFKVSLNSNEVKAREQLDPPYLGL